MVKAGITMPPQLPNPVGPQQLALPKVKLAVQQKVKWALTATL